MNMLQRIALLRESFRPCAIDPDALFLLIPDDALRYINAGVDLGLKLAGVEGFRITDQGAFQPCQELSTDFGEEHISESEFLSKTIRLIQQNAQRSIHFEVVFENA